MVQEQQAKRLYTSQDKLNYLTEKNPKVLELQRRLGLDIDF
jgi:DNA polymerase-3 subunit gamma/tau